jgi:hypothetical protein
MRVFGEEEGRERASLVMPSGRVDFARGSTHNYVHTYM